MDSERCASRRTSELALLVAVLEDGLVTFKEKIFAKGKHQKLFEDAENWIWNCDGEGFFSFENVCAQLDISPAMGGRAMPMPYKMRVYLYHDPCSEPMKLLQSAHETARPRPAGDLSIGAMVKKSSVKFFSS